MPRLTRKRILERRGELVDQEAIDKALRDLAQALHVEWRRQLREATEDAESADSDVA